MYYLYCFLKFLVLRLPRRISYAFAAFLAGIKFYLAKEDRRSVIYNLSPILGDKAKTLACARQVFENFAFYLVDFFSLSKINKEFIEKYVTITGQSNLDEAMKENRGVIVLSAHIGNYEFGASVAAVEAGLTDQQCGRSITCSIFKALVCRASPVHIDARFSRQANRPASGLARKLFRFSPGQIAGSHYPGRNSHYLHGSHGLSWSRSARPC